MNRRNAIKTTLSAAVAAAAGMRSPRVVAQTPPSTSGQVPNAASQAPQREGKRTQHSYTSKKYNPGAVFDYAVYTSKYYKPGTPAALLVQFDSLNVPQTAGVNASSPHIVVAGAGMGQTLRIASETDAYTLTDRGTFDALRKSVRLRELTSGDPRLLNTYAVIAEPSNDQGIRFARWWAEGDGRGTLAKMLSSGQVTGFALWSDGVPASSPDATVPK